MQETFTSPSPDQDRGDLKQVLDAAIGELASEDRNAILLRFFQGKGLREVGVVLGVSEDAARMRVNRSVQKLHSILSMRGVTLSVAALGTALAAEAASAPPAGLAAAIASAALTTVPVAGGTALTVVKILAMTKLKSGIITAIVVAGLAVPLLIQQHQAQGKLRKENDSLQQQVAQLEADNQTFQIAHLNRAARLRIRNKTIRYAS